LLPDGGKEASRATITIAAGVHGDEPAGPWALLSLVSDGLLDSAYTYRMWPCTNPSGYRLGTRENEEGFDINRSFSRGGTTPEAKAVITANRDRKFALSIDLHEDFEADGFYLYEPFVDGKALLSESIVGAIDDAGFPIQDLHEEFDFVYPQSSDQTHSRVERGRVLTHPESELAFTAGMPYNVFQLKHAARYVLTFESPRKLAWDDRIAIHRVAVTTAIDRLGLITTL
jgi:hypothetical protein